MVFTDIISFAFQNNIRVCCAPLNIVQRQSVPRILRAGVQSAGRGHHIVRQQSHTQLRCPIVPARYLRPVHVSVVLGPGKAFARANGRLTHVEIKLVNRRAADTSSPDTPFAVLCTTEWDQLPKNLKKKSLL